MWEQQPSGECPDGPRDWVRRVRGTRPCGECPTLLHE